MNYQVYNPPTALKHFVKCFWTLEDDGTAPPSRQRILPDGCMEMIFHYGDLYKQYFPDGSFILQPRSFIFGQISSYIEIEPTGISGIVSARFHPEGLAPLLAMPVSALEDKAVSLVELFGEYGRHTEEKIIAAAGNRGRIQLLEQFLLSRLSDPRTIDTITQKCVDVIFETQGQVATDALAEEIRLHRRSIERRFAATIGMSPRQLSKAVRFQTALKKLNEKKFTSLTSLAYESGYYDQAHFIKDFKEFTGISPKSFFSGNLRFATLFASHD